MVGVFKIFFILYFLEKDGENDTKGVLEAVERVCANEDKEEKKEETKQGTDKSTKQSKTL